MSGPVFWAARTSGWQRFTHAAASTPTPERIEKASAAGDMERALEKSERWYFGPVKDLDAKDPDPYTGLNWLFLAALRPKPEETDQAESNSPASVRRWLRRGSPKDPDFWNAIMTADAFLAESLLAGILAKRESSAACVDQLAERYRMAMQGVQVKPKELDSTVQHICLMALSVCCVCQGEERQGRGHHRRRAAPIGRAAFARRVRRCFGRNRGCTRLKPPASLRASRRTDHRHLNRCHRDNTAWRGNSQETCTQASQHPGMTIEQE